MADGMPDDDIWDEFDEQQELDLALHIAKMCEHMEWENTLPEKEKSKRRLAKLISRIPMTLKSVSAHGEWSVFVGEFERIVHHLKVLFGDNCLEDAAKRRSEWFERLDRQEDEDDYGDEWWKGNNQ